MRKARVSGSPVRGFQPSRGRGNMPPRVTEFTPRAGSRGPRVTGEDQVGVCMYWRQSVAYASLSDVGFRRANNQDSYAYQVCSEEGVWRSRGHLFLVADGMGGHAVGELASKLAADTVPHRYYQKTDQTVGEALVESLLEANRVINERGTHNREFDRMGTTCTALSLGPEGAFIAHVGDSRAYRIRNGLIEQLTFDHSLQWELIRQGAVKPEEVHLHHPRNVITRCLGPEVGVKVDLEGPHDVLPGDKYLLCSDGLTGHVNDDEIGCIAAALDPKSAAKLLVHLANLRGGSDNTTVVIVQVGDAPADPSIPRMPAIRSGNPPSSAALLGGMWAVLAGLAGGISLWILGQRAAGQALLLIAVLGLFGWVAFWWRSRQSHAPLKLAVGEESQGPYRRASARMTRRFLNHLAGVVGELQRTGEEEGWDIDAEKMQRLADEAGTAVEQKRPAHAMRLYGDAVDHFMRAIHDQRRIRDLEERWGRKDAPLDT